MIQFRFSKKDSFLLILLFFLIISPLFTTANSQNTSLDSNFTVSQLPDRVIIRSPTYDNNTNLYMSLTAGIQRPTSNPFFNLSYVDTSTNRIVFSTAYLFRELIEFTPTNTSDLSPSANTIVSRNNIGKNNTVLTSLNAMGYLPLSSNDTTFQGQTLHSFSLTTQDRIFSLVFNVPENTIYPNNVEVDVPGFYFTVKINNYPFQNSNDKLSLNIITATKNDNTINILPSNQLEIYKAYTGLNSTFYWQNVSSSIENSGPLSPRDTFLSSDYTFTGQNSSTLTMNGYIGQITPSPILPTSSSSSASNNPLGGILDYKIQSNTFNINTTVGDIAITGGAIAGIAGLIALIYYLIRKYILYIIGLLISVTVTIYLPTRKVNAIEALHHEKRREIMDELHKVAEKGLVMKELKELVDLPQTTLLWHLDVLEEFSFITKVKIHKQIVIISNDFLEKFDPRVKELELSFLSSQGEKFRQFINIKGSTGFFNLEQVTNFTDWHPKTARRHLKRMVLLGIIKYESNNKLYTVEPEFYKYFLKN